jgi:carboxypeptidase Taq
VSYAQLSAQHEKISHLSHFAALAEWDEATMMPSGGAATRGEALGTLEEFKHELSTDPRMKTWIAAAKQEELDTWQAANLREIERGHLMHGAFSGRLVGERARARSRCQSRWIQLRRENDWDSFVPELEAVLELEREAGRVLGETLGLQPYDALMQLYEPGGSSDAIDEHFGALRDFLPGFIEIAKRRSHGRGHVEPEGPFPIDAQRQLGLELMEAIGFDFERGRLDVSAHPFCGGVPSDVRITTRYDESDFASALMGVLHETGHAKYELGLPTNWSTQPVGLARSMSIHESQSLLQEMQLSRSRAFLEFAAPIIRGCFPKRAENQPEAYSVENLLRIQTRVEPGLIRVDADEVTYPCHVILRYEIERELIAGDLEVVDIPARWDAAMHDLLGLDTRGNFKDGPMQDIHWPSGAFGYFPTYTLGAMTAAQLSQAMRLDLPELDSDLAQGNFDAIDAWLRERVWSRASLHETGDLVEHATGKALGVEAFVTHLEARYG